MRCILHIFGTRAPCLQMDVQGFSRETVANATAASGLDLHYAKEKNREFFRGFSGAQKLWGLHHCREIINLRDIQGPSVSPPFLDEFWHMFSTYEYRYKWGNLFERYL
jgi:hypothetical protein